MESQFSGIIFQIHLGDFTTVSISWPQEDSQAGTADRDDLCRLTHVKSSKASGTHRVPGSQRRYRKKGAESGMRTVPCQWVSTRQTVGPGVLPSARAMGMELPGERVAPVLRGYSALMSGIT